MAPSLMKARQTHVPPVAHHPWGHFSMRFANNNAGKVEGAAKSAGASFVKFIKDNINVTIAAGLGLLAVNWATPFLYQRFYTQSVLHRLEEGVLPPPAPPAVLPRKALRDEMLSLMQPERPSRFFSLVLGAPGTGKTTLVRAACREMEGGVGYMECSPCCTDDFGRDLGETFDFKLEKHVNLFNIVTQTVVGRKTVDMAAGTGKKATLRRSCEALHAAAAEYRKLSGKPFVIVIDALDRLHADKEVMEAFMEYAKDWAQDGTISCLFITSQWDTALAVMGPHPAQGRAGAPLLVGEVTRSEGLHLLSSLGIGTEVASQCVDLVGGSLLLLERLAGLLHSGGSMTNAKAKLMELMALEFESIGIMGAAVTEENEPAVAALRALLAAPKGQLSEEEWKKAVPRAEVRRGLLGGGVMHHDGSKISFTSKLAEECAAGLLGKGTGGKSAGRS